MTNTPPTLLSLDGVVKRFRLRRRKIVNRGAASFLEAVSGVSFSVTRGETFGLVGESGSGKSTVARLITSLLKPSAGRIELGGVDISSVSREERKQLRKRVQMVFQDPYSSFDPMATIMTSLNEPLTTHFDLNRSERRSRTKDVLDAVGLSMSLVARYPSELSGGQLQRAALARAMLVKPDLLVLDEPVTALDTSTQGRVINLLSSLKSQGTLSYLFIAHDLAVVRHVSDRIGVMYLGKLMEVGPADDVYDQPLHPYTASLLSAIPIPDPEVQRSRRRIKLVGDIPSPVNPPSGCRFRTRCPFAMEVCAEVAPPPFEVNGHVTFCHLHTHGPKLEGASVVDLAES